MAMTFLPMIGAALLRTRLTSIERAGALFRVTLVVVPFNAGLRRAHVRNGGLAQANADGRRSLGRKWWRSELFPLPQASAAAAIRR